MVENCSPRQTWDALRTEAQARLVDVRTDAEWTYVGMPDLSAAGKQPMLIPWQIFPQMAVNSDFTDQMKTAGLTPDHHIYFICRSGVRSLAAARAAAEAGYSHVHNVSNGFEGPSDADGHRGLVAGWKADDLPWRQR